MLFASPRGIVLKFKWHEFFWGGWEKGRALSSCTSCIHKVDPWTIFGWLSWVCWICTFRLGTRVLLKPRSVSWSTSLARASGNCTSFLDSPFLLLVYPPLLLVHDLISQEGAHPLSCVLLFVASSRYVFVPFRSICCFEWDMSVSRHL